MKRLFKNGRIYDTRIFNPTSTVEHLKMYAEKLMFESDINIDNVHIHNEGQFGQAGICTTFESRYSLNLHDIKFNIIPNTPYIIVPEVTDWWSFRAWIHEIGHLRNRHHKSITKPLYYQEYEAELYCVNIAKECEHIDEETFNKIKESAMNYLIQFIEANIESGYFKRMYSIPKKVREFLFEVGGNHYRLSLEKAFLDEKPNRFNIRKYISFLSRITDKLVYFRYRVKHNIINIYMRCSKIMVWEK